jgi:L,D-peptidoglycan transpeptidase YkuD (ErfK/YbiS/YcfS/YnhG family)
MTEIALSRLVVNAGRLSAGSFNFACAVGRSGIRAKKREGDGATPSGCFPLRRLLYRPDRHISIATGLPVQKLQPDDAWCDDPSDPHYNQFIKRPTSARHEILWRTDTLYDVIVVIGYNDAPVIAGRGSAIFLHIASPDMTPTDGCVALAAADLLHLVGMIDGSTVIAIVGDRNRRRLKSLGSKPDY